MIEAVKIWARALRVEQWTKNGVVMMAWFFSVADASQRDIVRGWESFLMAVAMAAMVSLSPPMEIAPAMASTSVPRVRGRVLPRNCAR